MDEMEQDLRWLEKNTKRKSWAVVHSILGGVCFPAPVSRIGPIVAEITVGELR